VPDDNLASLADGEIFVVEDPRQRVAKYTDRLLERYAMPLDSLGVGGRDAIESNAGAQRPGVSIASTRSVEARCWASASTHNNLPRTGFPARGDEHVHLPSREATGDRGQRLEADDWPDESTTLEHRRNAITEKRRHRVLASPRSWGP